MKQPVLLSGGNPQIPTGKGGARVRACVAAMPASRLSGERM